MQHGGTESGQTRRRAQGRCAHSPVLDQGRAGLPVRPLHPSGRLSPALWRAAAATAAVREASWPPLAHPGRASVRPSVRPRRGAAALRPPGCAEWGGRRRRPGCGSGCQDAVAMGTRSAGGSAAPAARGRERPGGGGREEHPGGGTSRSQSSLPRGVPWPCPLPGKERGDMDPANGSGAPCGAADGRGRPRSSGPRRRLPHRQMSASGKKVWRRRHSSYSEFLAVRRSWLREWLKARVFFQGVQHILAEYEIVKIGGK